MHFQPGFLSVETELMDNEWFELGGADYWLQCPCGGRTAFGF